MDMVVSASMGAMEALLPKLAEMLNDEYNLHKGVKDGIVYLRKELEAMQIALEKVSEVPADQLDKQVNLWARDLKDMSYDIEDTIDSYMVRVDAAGESSSSTTGCINIKSMLPSMYKARRNIATEIERIKKQVDEMSKRRKRLKVDGIDVALAPSDPRLLALYVDEAKLVGIDRSREELIKLLSMEGEGASEQKLKLVSIVGPGGMGKTTLANAVYQKLQEHFDCAAFISVSLKPNIKNILSSILRQVRRQKYENAQVEDEKDGTDKIKDVPKAKDKRINRQERQRNYENTEAWFEQEIMDDIIDVLKDKRYFIVIDDIWEESAWKFIKCVLIENNCGSKIITTTRNINVAKFCHPSDNVDGIIHELQPLSNIDSEKLFYDKVFRGGRCPPKFKDVSQKILESCHGWPLAIVTVASLLANKLTQTEDQWYSVYNSIRTGLESCHGVKDMRGILSLSYYDLPRQLKACFLYLSMFPEDHIIRRDDLIWRWAAEGFVHAKQDENLYELGETYFNDLINRSMIQPTHVDAHGRAQAFHVHDMVLEFITSLSTEENFVTILTSRRCPSQPNNIRRLSLRNSKGEHGVPPIIIWPHVRSLVVFSHAINLMPSLRIFQVLRVLDLELRSSNDIKGVGKLLLLRYLRLSHTYYDYIELPEEIGNLRFLQIMDLKEARIKELPSAVFQLRQLCALEILLGKWDKGYGKSLLRYLDSLNKIQSLYIIAPDLSLDFMLQIDWAPTNLRRFTASIRRQNEETFFWSASCPSIWPDFSPFSTLPMWINSSLSNLSDLSIMVRILRQEDLESLGGLTALLCLDLHVIVACTKERLEITCSTGSIDPAIEFRCLSNFKFASRAMGLVFRQEAMQSLQRLSLIFDIAETKDVHGDFNLGLENLKSLKVVDIGIDCTCARLWEVEAAEAAMRAATDLNTNHPTFDVSRHFEREMLWDQEEEIPDLGIMKKEDAGLARIGPWGGNGGRARDIRVPPRRLESVTICSSDLIDSLSFSYSDHDGQHRTVGPWGGGHGGSENTIHLGPSEFLKEVSGTVGSYFGLSSIITSLTLVTNARTHGPFGRGGRGIPFNIPAQGNGSIVGFFGRAGWYVDAIGVYVRPF